MLNLEIIPSVRIIIFYYITRDYIKTTTKSIVFQREPQRDNKDEIMILEERQNDRKLWVIFAVLILLVVLNSFRTVFNVDEIEHIHSAWKVINTGPVFRDFFQHHHPLLYYISAPIIAIVGDNTATLIALRLMALTTLLAIVFVTYKISEKLFDKRTALLSVVLLASMRVFIHRAMEVRPDTPQVLFGLISIFFLFSFYSNRSRRDLVISAVALAISFIFLQKAVLLIFFLGIIMLMDIIRRDLTIKDVLVFSIAFLVSLVPFYAYLFFSGSIENYLLYAWGSNLGGLPHPFSPLHNIWTTIRRNTLVWAFYIPGLLLVLKTAKLDWNRVRLAILATGLFLTVFIPDHPNPQYFMHSAPLIIVLASFALTHYFRTNFNRLLILVIIGTIIPAFAIAKRPFKKSNIAQFERINYALSITDEEDRVHEPRRYFNLFREDINFFWYYADDIVNIGLCEKINKERPVLVTDKMLDPNCRHLTEDYERSKVYSDIFIRIKKK
jgi:4-amino-4-deoxy-L-arabinose transferase-like glycosyltransferase